MPCLGLIPFLQGYGEQHRILLQCVNALSRAHSISTIMTDEHYPTYSMCQCPVSGSFHFYPVLQETLISKAFQSHFYGYFSEYSEICFLHDIFLAVHNLFIFMHPLHFPCQKSSLNSKHPRELSKNNLNNS